MEVSFIGIFSNCFILGRVMLDLVPFLEKHHGWDTCPSWDTRTHGHGVNMRNSCTCTVSHAPDRIRDWSCEVENLSPCATEPPDGSLHHSKPPCATLQYHIIVNPLCSVHVLMTHFTFPLRTRSWLGFSDIKNMFKRIFRLPTGCSVFYAP